jgi:hypothetical protein
MGEAAVRVRTEANFPVQWAMTQNNLGNALADLGEVSGVRDLLERARTCFAAALRGLRLAGMGDAAREADERAQVLSESQTSD